MTPLNIFHSPFVGDWDWSKETIFEATGILSIAEFPPITSATIHYPTYDEVIEAGEGKYFGLAFFIYCLKKYGSEDEKGSGVFTITFVMASEAMLYYGAKLWSDYKESHPSIMPFRATAQGVSNITIELKYDPDH